MVELTIASMDAPFNESWWKACFGDVLDSSVSITICIDLIYDVVTKPCKAVPADIFKFWRRQT